MKARFAVFESAFAVATALALGCSILFFPALASAQSAGHVEFRAVVTSRGGQPEPVRQMTFILLRKSIDDIRKEASANAPAANLDAFIDKLGMSSELTAWMHKHQSVQLTGREFIKSLTADEVVDIPEFFKAYMDHTAAYRGLGFPEPKYREKDKSANPEKYKALHDQYITSVKAFIAANMDTLQGMDLELVSLNPAARWESIDRKNRASTDARAEQLAAQRYAVARTTTDLDGRGSFSGIAPGTYWISLTGAEAMSGDVHLRWDFPVTVEAGQTTSVELSNYNALQPSASAQNSEN